MAAEAKSGYDPSRFVKPPDEDLVCAICLMVAQDAVETECGHLFCALCMKQWMATSHTCPVDRTKIKEGEVRPNRYIRNKILNSMLKCDCEIVHSVRNLKAHQRECVNNRKRCDICDIHVKSDLYEAHLADQLGKHHDALVTENKQLKEEVHGLKDAVSGLGNEATGLKNEVTGLRNEATGLANEIVLLKTQVRGLKKMIEKSQIDDLNAKLQNIEKQVNDLQTEQKAPSPGPNVQQCRHCDQLFTQTQRKQECVEEVSEFYHPGQFRFPHDPPYHWNCCQARPRGAEGCRERKVALKHATHVV